MGENVVIAGADGVNQVIFHGLRTIPCFAGGDGVDVQLRAVAADVVLEQVVGDGQLVAELLPVCVGIFTKKGQAALMLARGVFFVADAVLLQQFVEIGQRANDANRTQNGKRRRYQLVGKTRHHVTAASRDFIDRNHQRNLPLAQPRQLRGCEAVGVHQAAAALQPQQDAVFRSRHLNHRADLFA